MAETDGMYFALWIGILPLLGAMFWWWNDIWFGLSVTLRCSAAGKLPPGYMGIPIFGEMFSFLWYFKLVRRPEDFINNKRKKYGDGEGLYRTHLVGSPAIISCSPAATKFVFQTEAENFYLEWPTIQLLGKHSIVAVQGTAHTRIRSFVLRAINQPDALRRIALTLQPRIISSLESWAHNGRVQVSIEAKKVTLQNIGKYFAGFETGPILDTLDELFAEILKGVRSIPINIPGTTYHHALQSRKKAMDIFKAELEKRKKDYYSGSGMVKNDLLEGLLKLRDEEGKQLCDDEVLDNICSLVIAGYESTSISIMWAIYFLAKYPETLKKLREEQLSLGKKSGDLITSDEVLKLKYSSRVVEETIRMANVAPFLFRTAKKDIEYKGYKIPKGWKMIVWTRHLHTDPENFDDPLCFNPDRWIEPAKLGTNLIFGGGSRSCAGNMLARMQVGILLHHLALGYRWELVNPNAEVHYLPHPRPGDGVEIRISKIFP